MSYSPEQSVSHETKNQPILDVITFTGLDEKTELEDIYDIHQRYPKTEFAILVADHNGKAGYNRLPTMETVHRWRHFSQEYDIPLAVHLSGKYTRMLTGSPREQAAVLALCNDVERVQINTTSKRLMQNWRILNFLENVRCSKVILPFQTDLTNPPWRDYRIEYLFDRSSGQGLASFQAWPEPDRYQERSGYAGGINADNLDQALSFLKHWPLERFWLSIESGIRNDYDWLDPAKILAICEIAFSTSEA